MLEMEQNANRAIAREARMSFRPIGSFLRRQSYILLDNAILKSPHLAHVEIQGNWWWWWLQLGRECVGGGEGCYKQEVSIRTLR